jgi:hypothetical protein
MGRESADKMDGMSIKQNTAVTFQKGRELYKICCGKHVGEQGRLRPTIHWLGKDEEHAQYAAFTIRKGWASLEGSGRDRWTKEDLQQVRDLIGDGANMFRVAIERINRTRKGLDQQEQFLHRHAAFIVPGQPSPAPAAVATDRKSPTLYGAIRAYLDSLNAKQVSDGHKERATQILETNLKRSRPDCPMADVDFAWLESLANHFRSRPSSLKEKDQRISANTAALFLRYLKAFFVWLDDAGWNGWEGPRKLTKLFRCSVADMMTAAELRESTIIQQFDIRTLVKLYAAANDFTRRCMLLGIFAGATQQELTVMEKDEFDLEKGTLHRFRNKTRVEGKFWIPPEAVELLKADFAKRPKDELAMRSPEGLALVVFKDGTKVSDSVRQSWDHLRQKPGLEGALSFKFLRKFLADYVTRHGGEELGMVAMSHARTTVLSKSYTNARQFERVNELQRQLYGELKAAGMFDQKVEVKGKTKNAA